MYHSESRNITTVILDRKKQKQEEITNFFPPVNCVLPSPTIPLHVEWALGQSLLYIRGILFYFNKVSIYIYIYISIIFSYQNLLKYRRFVDDVILGDLYSFQMISNHNVLFLSNYSTVLDMWPYLLPNLKTTNKKAYQGMEKSLRG